MQINYNIGFGLQSVVIIIISDLLQNSSLDCTDLFLQQLSWIPVEESWVMWLANIWFLLIPLCVCSFIHSLFHAIFDPKIHSFTYWRLIKLSFIFHLYCFIYPKIQLVLWLLGEVMHIVLTIRCWITVYSLDKNDYWNTYKLTVNIIFFFWSNCPTVSAIDCKNNKVITKWLINVHKFEGWWLYLITDHWSPYNKIKPLNSIPA